jgi:hypothetical protein
MTTTAKRLSLLCIVFVISIGTALAQLPGGLKYASTSVAVTPKAVPRGGASTIDVTIKVAPGFHINSVKPNDPDLIATTAYAGPVKGLKYGDTVYPTAKTISAPSLSQKPLSVYTGTSIIKIRFTVSVSVKPGQYVIPVSVSYQGCNTSACFPPKTDTLNAKIVVK